VANRRAAFTLIEAVVATALLGIGVSAAVGALAQLTRAEATLNDRVALHRLAQERLDEFLATSDSDATNLDGGFEDRGRPTWSWSAEVVPTGVENLEEVTVTATDAFGATVTARTARYRPPTTSNTGTGIGVAAAPQLGKRR